MIATKNGSASGKRRGILKALGTTIEGMRRRVAPSQEAGVGGAVLYNGYLHTHEKSPDLRYENRYTTYSEILANISIVAASVRYYLDLVGKAQWRFEPADDSVEAERIAEFCQKALTERMATPWYRVVRRAGMWAFYGFSVQEWTSRRARSGEIVFANIKPRPQRTITRWDLNDTQDVLGCVQRTPDTFAEVYLPRTKMVYVVDDSIEDGPEGLGIFRHLAEPCKRLKYLQEWEVSGFETDLRGIPIARVPLELLRQLVESGDLTKEDRDKLLQPFVDFVRNHTRTPETALVIDSLPYLSQDEAATPSGAPQWDVELMKSSSSTMPEVADAVRRINREVARMLGTEHLLLGESSGSRALSEDKSDNFALTVDSSLMAIASTMQTDVLRTLVSLNGWDERLTPRAKVESTRMRDVLEVVESLERLARAGAPLSPDDEAIGEVFDLLGLSRPDFDRMMEDAILDRQRTEVGVGAAPGGAQTGDSDEGETEADRARENA